MLRGSWAAFQPSDAGTCRISSPSRSRFIGSAKAKRSSAAAQSRSARGRFGSVPAPNRRPAGGGAGADQAGGEQHDRPIAGHQAARAGGGVLDDSPAAQVERGGPGRRVAEVQPRRGRTAADGERGGIARALREGAGDRGERAQRVDQHRRAVQFGAARQVGAPDPHALAPRSRSGGSAGVSACREVSGTRGVVHPCLAAVFTGEHTVAGAVVSGSPVVSRPGEGRTGAVAVLPSRARFATNAPPGGAGVTADRTRTAAP